MVSALQIAMALSDPVADCVYLALARSLSCDLVTADERFATRAIAGGYTNVVRLGSK